MAKSHLKPVTPATVKRTVIPKRLPNAQLRSSEHLTEAEVERLMKAAGKNRWGHRDATMILVAYRHGLQSLRACRSPVGSGGLRQGHLACPACEAGHAQHPSDPRGRASGIAATSARAGVQITLYLHVGAWSAL